MKTIPESHRSLLNSTITVCFATLMPNGQPQITPAWCDLEGDLILLNTAVGRQKDINLQNNPKVTVFAMDPQNDHHWIEIRGHVAERTTQGAVEHIDKLSFRYFQRGYDSWKPHPPKTETRVIYKIAADSINLC